MQQWETYNIVTDMPGRMVGTKFLIFYIIILAPKEFEFVNLWKSLLYTIQL